MEIVKKLASIEKFQVLAYPEYLKTLNGVADFGYFVENDVVLPFVIRKKGPFKWIQLDSPVENSPNEEKEREFLNNVVAYVKKNLKVSHIMSTNTAIFSSYPTDSYYCKFGSYIVDLTLTEDELFKGLHSKHRNVVRKAMSDGIEIFHGQEYATDAIKIMQETFGRQNKVSGLDDSMIKRMLPLGENVDYWVAKDSDGNLQGSAIFLWNNGHSCYYMHGGSAAHTKPGAMNLLIWEAMKCMKERGVLVFDFVGARITTDPGSKLEGIQRFKSRFGSTLKVGYMFRVVTNKFYYTAYNIAVKSAFLLLQHKLPGDPITEEREKGNM